MSLREHLIARIAQEGPISVADYMDACLHDPEDGYYAVRPALGEAGDFITAPHVSQMFGELIGLWAASVWAELGQPTRLRLVELGPGDGALMADALRAGRAALGFLAAAEVWLVETSAPLRERQKTTLNDHAIRWACAIEEIPADIPVILIANEFLDCLPIRQAEWQGGRWRERMIGLDASGALAFVSSPAPLATPFPQADEAWDIFEWSDALTEVGRKIGALIARASGAALLIDYGRDRPEFGDTLQALRGHLKEGALDSPGHADLTAHVDFPTFAEAARAAGSQASAVRTQGNFLRALGIEARAGALIGANPEAAGRIGRQLRRLIAPEAMGELFKAVCIHSMTVNPPGFEA
jgi:NADH dehydrogenase [ubiquinone] 1 alpha subcomplex assembly factor 7